MSVTSNDRLRRAGNEIQDPAQNASSSVMAQPLLPDVTELQRLSISDQHLASQPGMLRQIKAGVGSEEPLRFASSSFEYGPIAAQVGNSQRGQTMLLRPEQITRTSQLEVHFRQLKTIGGSGERG
jgi:hypothetical protein